MPSEIRFTRHFADLPDPRVDRAKKHRLVDILGIDLCAVICGADSFEEIERFGEAREDGLRGFLALPNGIPTLYSPREVCEGTSQNAPVHSTFVLNAISRPTASRRSTAQCPPRIRPKPIH